MDKENLKQIVLDRAKQKSELEKDAILQDFDTCIGSMFGRWDSEAIQISFDMWLGMRRL